MILSYFSFRYNPRPDIIPRRQEVWKAPPKATIRHSGVCCKLCQLQGAQEGPLHTIYAATGKQLTLVQLIKQLSATPTLLPQNAPSTNTLLDPQAALHANRATFFFRLVSPPFQCAWFFMAKLGIRKESLRKSMPFTSTRRPRFASHRVV